MTQISRKQSIEYFREESNKLEAKINSNSSGKKSKTIRPRKKFTGINKNLEKDFCYSLEEHDKNMTHKIKMAKKEFNGDQKKSMQALAIDFVSMDWMNYK